MDTNEYTVRHKVRCYPSESQRQQLAIEFEACRVVYNLCVEMCRHLAKDASSKAEQRRRYPGTPQLNKAITLWKTQTSWPLAKAASNMCLQWSARHANDAFTRFFRGLADRPVFKKGGHTAGAATYDLVNLHWNASSGKLRLSKQDTELDLNWDQRGLPRSAKSVTIMRDACGRYFASFTCKKVIPALAESAYEVGIDLGIVRTLAYSDSGHGLGDGDQLPQLLSRQRGRRFLHLQRKLARQEKGSAGFNKTKLAIARLHARIADSREAWHNRISRKIVDRAGLIAIEDLQLSNMTSASKPKPGPSSLLIDGKPARYLQNNAKAKSKLNARLLNVGGRALRTKLEYKAKWAGRTVIAVSPAYTSQTCSACGHRSAENRKTQARFVCESCGHTANADTNAANNIHQKAKLLIAGQLAPAV